MKEAGKDHLTDPRENQQHRRSGSPNNETILGGGPAGDPSPVCYLRYAGSSRDILRETLIRERPALNSSRTGRFATSALPWSSASPPLGGAWSAGLELNQRCRGCNPEPSHSATGAQWCLGMGSNHRRAVLQTAALPLSYQGMCATAGGIRTHGCMTLGFGAPVMYLSPVTHRPTRARRSLTGLRWPPNRHDCPDTQTAPLCHQRSRLVPVIIERTERRLRRGFPAPAPVGLLLTRLPDLRYLASSALHWPPPATSTGSAPSFRSGIWGSAAFASWRGRQCQPTRSLSATTRPAGQAPPAGIAARAWRS